MSYANNILPTCHGKVLPFSKWCLVMKWIPGTWLEGEAALAAKK